MNGANKFDFETLKVRDGGAEAIPAPTAEFEAGGLSLPILDVDLNGEMFELLRMRMGGTEVECLLRIKNTDAFKQTPNA